jgi:molybdopterin-guanine dinucleotide biosynthesis protein A
MINSDPFKMPRDLSDPVLQAVIISGGSAARAGGINKSFMRLDGRKVLDHQLDRLTPVFADRIAVATDRADDYRGYDVKIVEIIQFVESAAQRSSLRGLVSALTPFAERWCFLLACDMPWPDAEVLAAQIEWLKSAANDAKRPPLGVCLDDGKRQRPFHSLIHGSLGEAARKRLAASGLTQPISTRDWLTAHPAVGVAKARDLGLGKKTIQRCLTNLNSAAPD